MVPSKRGVSHIEKSVFSLHNICNRRNAYNVYHTYNVFHVHDTFSTYYLSLTHTQKCMYIFKLDVLPTTTCLCACRRGMRPSKIPRLKVNNREICASCIQIS